MQDLLWVLVLVTPGDLVEWGTYEDAEACLRVGSYFIETALDPKTDPDYEVQGFFCEREEPEPTSQEIPKCTDPIEQCA